MVHLRSMHISSYFENLKKATIESRKATIESKKATIEQLLEIKAIEPMSGHGKGKYKFTQTLE